MVALDPEGNPQGTGGLVGVHDVDTLREEYALSLWVVCDEVGEADVRGGNDYGGEVVGLDTVNVPDSVVVGRVAVSDYYDFTNPLFQDLAHLLDVHFYAS